MIRFITGIVAFAFVVPAHASHRNPRSNRVKTFSVLSSHGPLTNSNKEAVRLYLSRQLELSDLASYDLSLGMKERLKAISREQAEDPTFIRNTLEKYFSKNSSQALGRILRAMWKTQYNNVVLLGPPGTGKTFILNQIVSALSFGVVPDFLEEELGGDDGAMYRTLREEHLGKVDVVMINTSLLSQNPGGREKPFSSEPMRIQQILNDLFESAEKQFRAGGRRTLFVIDEVATMPEVLREAIKKPLDRSGYRDSSNPELAVKDAGFSMLLMTTDHEWEKKVVKGDQAVARRVKKVHVSEPSEEEAFRIVRGYADGEWERVYGIRISDGAIKALIRMRKLLSNPPRAMPGSIIDGANDLFVDAVEHLGNEEAMIEPRTVLRFIMKAAGLSQIWLEGPNGEPPMHDLAERVKRLVVGHDEIVDKIANSIKTWARTGFGSDIPVFIIGGPSGSGKDTIVRAFSQVLFGHTSDHLTFGLGGAAGFRIESILEGPPQGNHSDGELPLFLQRLNQGPRAGFLVLNEVKDAPSDQIDKLKLPLERGVISPAGRDNHPRLILFPIFLLGQWGEELFQGLNDEESATLVERLSQAKIEAPFLAGKASGVGAIPDAIAKRARRTGGIYMLPPVPKKSYPLIVNQYVARFADAMRVNHGVGLSVSVGLVNYIGEVAAKLGLDTRALEALTVDFTKSAFSHAADLGLPLNDVDVAISLKQHSDDWSKAQIIVSSGEREWSFAARDLYRGKTVCEAALTE